VGNKVKEHGKRVFKSLNNSQEHSLEQKRQRQQVSPTNRLLWIMSAKKLKQEKQHELEQQ